MHFTSKVFQLKEKKNEHQMFKGKADLSSSPSSWHTQSANPSLPAGNTSSPRGDLLATRQWHLTTEGHMPKSPLSLTHTPRTCISYLNNGLFKNIYWKGSYTERRRDRETLCPVFRPLQIVGMLRSLKSSEPQRTETKPRGSLIRSKPGLVQ